MKIQSTMMNTAGAVALGTLLALSGASAASAAEHDATTTDGVADVRIQFGAEFAGATATVLVLDADADPDAPVQTDIAYVTEIVADAEGTASFRAVLPDGLDYWLASTVTDGDRYVAMLDGSEGGPGDGDPGDGDTDGGDTDGGTDGGDGGESGDDGNPGSGSDSGAGGSVSEGSGDADLATTGMAAWLVPAGLLAAGGLIAAGGALLRRRRAES